MSDYYDDGGYGYNTGSGDGNGAGDQSSAYTYIPTDPIEPDDIKTPEKKRKERRSGGNNGGRRILRNVLVALLCAVVFGAAGAGAFIGVMKISGYEDTLRSLTETEASTAEPSAIETVEPVETVAPSSGSSFSGSGYSVADIAENAMPSLVAITNTQIYESYDWGSFFWGGSGSTQQEVTGSGSGVIVGQNDEELLILTNYHVVEDATSLTVTFIDETSVDADVRGAAEDNDIAVVSVALEDLDSSTLSAIKIATFGDSDALRVGDEVIAIGNALGYGQTLTWGHISALSRELTVEGRQLTMLQTDAAINPGNSGGALLNTEGELIGINTAKSGYSDAEGIGWAIPISEVYDLIEGLMTAEKRTAVDDENASWLGISGVDVDSSSAAIYDMPEGIYVYSITENGPASRSELQEKDIITALNGTSLKSMDDLKAELLYYSGGTTVTLTVQRVVNGSYETVDVSVTLGFKSENPTLE